MTHTIPTRSLGSSGIEGSEIGLGCNRIGESMLTDSEWIGLLHRANELGITLFDTAMRYSGGRSQELIGKAFANRDDIVISTKIVAQSTDDGPRFPYGYIIESAENCLRILKRDCIEIFQTHGNGKLDEMQDPDLARALNDLQESGKIRLRASATFHADGACYAMENGIVDALQITYNLIDRDHATPILPVAETHGIGILARMPYQRGSLTGKFKPGSTVDEGHRALLQGDKLQDEIAKAESFRALAGSRDGGMSELAIAYALDERRISSTIPGARSVEQLEANIDNALAPKLTSEEKSEIERIQNSLTN